MEADRSIKNRKIYTSIPQMACGEGTGPLRSDTFVKYNKNMAAMLNS